MSHICIPVVGDRRWMDQWRYWTIHGGHFASSAREDRNLAFGTKHSPPTLELRTSTISPWSLHLQYRPPGHHHPIFCADPDLPGLLAYVGRRVVERDVQLRPNGCQQTLLYYVRDAQLGLSELRYFVSYVDLYVAPSSTLTFTACQSSPPLPRAPSSRGSGTAPAKGQS